MMLRKTKFEGCHLLVGTPGRLNDLLSDDYSGIDAPNLSALVLDEADRMLDVGFDRELQDIVQLLPSRQEKPRQTLLFSATIPKNVVSLARTYINPSNFQFVQTINPDEAPTHEKVPQHIVTVPDFEHYIPTLLEIVEKAQAGQHGPDPFKAIVFFNSTVHVKLFQQLFDILPRYVSKLPPTYGIQSGMDQRQRTRAADNFRRAHSGILLSSDVTARGMDFPNVTHVIQFGVPPDREQYIHRLGRTGRANKSGQGWLIVRQSDIPVARKALPGLPIKRNDELQCPLADPNNQDQTSLPPYFKQVADAMRRVSPNMIADAYVRFLSGDKGKIQNIQSIVDSANSWTRNQCGMRDPPSVPFSVLRYNPGLERCDGINTGRNTSASSNRDRGGFNNSARRGSGSGGRRDNGDPFNSMSSGRRDDRPSQQQRAAF